MIQSYWQQVVTHEKIDLHVEVIQDPDNKYVNPHYAIKLFKLLFEVPRWNKLLKIFEEAEEKEQLHFHKKAETKFTNTHVELFFRTEKLDKTELRAVVAEYIKRTYSRRRGSQRQFVDSYSKTERKISKTETKILTHASGFSEEQSLEKSDDEERNQPTTESKFRNHGRKNALQNLTETKK